MVKKYIARQDGEMVKRGDVIEVDWDHIDSEWCRNLTQNTIFSPLGSDYKVLAEI